MVFSWFWIVHIPRVTVGMSDQIAVFEALAVSGLAFLLSEPLTESAQSNQEAYAERSRGRPSMEM